MLELFPYQFLGDIIKIASWLISYLMIAKAMARLFITMEIIFSFLLVGWVVLICKIVWTKRWYNYII